MVNPNGQDNLMSYAVLPKITASSAEEYFSQVLLSDSFSCKYQKFFYPLAYFLMNLKHKAVYMNVYSTVSLSLIESLLKI